MHNLFTLTNRRGISKSSANRILIKASNIRNENLFLFQLEVQYKDLRDFSYILISSQSENCFDFVAKIIIVQIV